MTHWQRWMSHPQTAWLRKAIFQLHMWSGIGVGLYVLLVSVTGSIVVYRNELYTAATRDPIVVAQSGPGLTDDELQAAATRVYPGYTMLGISRGQKPDQAVSISLNGRIGRKDRLFNPYTGEDLGDSTPLGIRLVSRLLELHDDLFAGSTGRSVNGLGALLVIALALTGIVVWWPGIKTWRRSLKVHRNVGWRRFTWDLHSMIGFWTFAFIVVFGLSGAYLGNPELVQDLADRLQPPTANSGTRIVDDVIYWLAYLHFGRINGIGIPCRGPGLCDQTTKLVWALFGLAPAAMFVTGTVMWWNRVVRKKFGRNSHLEAVKREES
ncbi:MAG TPA: PepSY-associated TM helix domain-containing protein [Terriglobia bacterium]|nr:PepSY-associated TM helix domain-containing protein [Terriglobia bacterium]